MSLLPDVRENLGSVYKMALLAVGGVAIVGAKPDKMAPSPKHTDF